MLKKRKINNIAFYVNKKVNIPLHLREYYVSIELKKKGYNVFWLLPYKSTFDKFPFKIDWSIIYYKEFNFLGSKYFFSIYIFLLLLINKISILWVSGWGQRNLDLLQILFKIIKKIDIKIIYDPVDPVIEYDSIDINLNQSNQKYVKIMEKVYNQCNLILTVTPELKKLIKQKYHISRHIIKCARWGTDLSIFKKNINVKKYRSNIINGNKKFLIGWLGTMSEFKGIEEIILPLMKSLKEYKDIYFVIAGKGKLKNVIENFIKTEKVNAKLINEISYFEAPFFTKALDLYLVPTNPGFELAENICPVKIFDAIQMGTSVITTKTKATLFLEKKFKNVFLCNFNVDSFRKKILILKKNKNKYLNNEKIERIKYYSHQYISKKIVSFIIKINQK